MEQKALQDKAGSVEFRYMGISTTVTEVSWECTNNSNQKVQERERTTTTETSISGVVTTVARERNQITGFNLTEYASGVKEESTVATDGPTVNSCSNNSTLTKRAGDPVVDGEASTSTGGLQVSTDGQNWTDI